MPTFAAKGRLSTPDTNTSLGQTDQCTGLPFPVTSFIQSYQPGPVPWILSNHGSGFSLQADHAETITELLLEGIPLI